MSWESLAVLLTLAALPFALRAPLRLSLFATSLVGFVSLIMLFQYRDDEPNPWYVEASFVVLPAAVLLAGVLVGVRALRAR